MSGKKRNKADEKIESKIKGGLERISEIYKVQLIEVGLRYGLSATQIQIIHKLKSEKEVELGRIRDMLGIDITTLSKSIKTLEKKEIVVHRKKGKKKLLSLTTKGKKIKTEGKISKILENMLDELDRKSKETIYLFIYKLIEESLENGIIKFQRMCSACVYFSVRRNKPYCLLLQKKLDVKDLRINCEDFIPKT